MGIPRMLPSILSQKSIPMLLNKWKINYCQLERQQQLWILKGKASGVNNKSGAGFATQINLSIALSWNESSIVEDDHHIMDAILGAAVTWLKFRQPKGHRSLRRSYREFWEFCLVVHTLNASVLYICILHRGIFWCSC